MEFMNHLGNFCNGCAKLLGNFFLPLLVIGLRQELVQRWIEQSNASWQAIESSEDAFEVFLLVWQQGCQSALSSFVALGQDHLADGDDAVPFEEHVLGSAKSNTFSSESHSVEHLVGLVCVGSQSKRSVLVCELHDEVVVLENLRVFWLEGLADENLLQFAISSVDLAVEDFPGRSVDADVIPFFQGNTFALQDTLVVVDFDIACTGNADLTHLTGDESCVAGDPTASGEDTFGSDHSAKIFWAGFDPSKHDALALSGQFFGFTGGEDHGASSGTWTCWQTNCHQSPILLGLVVSLQIEDRLKKLVEGFWIPGLDRMLRSHELLFDHVVSDLDISQRSSLSVPCLEHVKLLVFNGEFKILYVTKVLLKGLANFNKFLVSRSEDLVLGHFGNLQWRANASHDVFTLCIDKVFAVEDVIAVSRVAGERNAGRAIFAHVAEDHALDVHGGAPFIRNAVLLTIKNCSLIHPRSENGLDCTFKLLHWLVGERFACPLLDELLVSLDQFLKMSGGQVGIFRDPYFVLQTVHDFFERFVVVFVLLLDTHHNVAVHLDESAVGVPSEAWVVGRCCKPFGGRIVESKVQNRIHHTGHGVTSAGTNGNQQGVLDVAELLA